MTAKEGIEEQITRLLESQLLWHNCDQRNGGIECPVATSQNELKSALLTIFQEQVKEIIGEDEKFSLTDNKFPTDTGERKYVRNQLRAKQRKLLERRLICHHPPTILNRF